MANPKQKNLLQGILEEVGAHADILGIPDMFSREYRIGRAFELHPDDNEPTNNLVIFVDCNRKHDETVQGMFRSVMNDEAFAAYKKDLAERKRGPYRHRVMTAISRNQFNALRSLMDRNGFKITYGGEGATLTDTRVIFKPKLRHRSAKL